MRRLVRRLTIFFHGVLDTILTFGIFLTIIKKHEKKQWQRSRYFKLCIFVFLIFDIQYVDISKYRVLIKVYVFLLIREPPEVYPNDFDDFWTCFSSWKNNKHECKGQNPPVKSTFKTLFFSTLLVINTIRICYFPWREIFGRFYFKLFNRCWEIFKSEF